MIPWAIHGTSLASVGSQRNFILIGKVKKIKIMNRPVIRCKSTKKNKMKNFLIRDKSKCKCKIT